MLARPSPEFRQPPNECRASVGGPFCNATRNHPRSREPSRRQPSTSSHLADRGPSSSERSSQPVRPARSPRLLLGAGKAFAGAVAQSQISLETFFRLKLVFLHPPPPLAPFPS